MADRYLVTGVAGLAAAHEAQVIGYRVRLLDAAERQILADHWHPAGVSPVTFPHLHLSSRVGSIALDENADRVSLAEMHLPTDFVSLQAIVRLLITEFGVEPRRDD